mmetsp:Transcript_42256/g.66189  ORF Transcript_42256/g.66189 Transcript_42256/m.66189 type:complete len:149 (+) Transcript_42256:303-749(+)
MEVPEWKQKGLKLGPNFEGWEDFVQSDLSDEALEKHLRAFGSDYTAVDYASRMQIEIQPPSDVTNNWAETIAEARARREPLSHAKAQQEFGINIDHLYAHLQLPDLSEESSDFELSSAEGLQSSSVDKRVLESWELGGGYDFLGQQTT